MENVNNQTTIIGQIADEFAFSHEICSEKFYIGIVKVTRFSGTCDEVKVTVSERIILDYEYKAGDTVEVEGDFRSHNIESDGESHLLLTVFANKLSLYDETAYRKNPNTIYLNGFICKKPIYRLTPLGRQITDLILAVNRRYGKSDYIPVIVWGRNAQFAGNLSIGDNVAINGRIQSRQYQKCLDSGETVTRTAYEVSAFTIELLNKSNNK